MKVHIMTGKVYNDYFYGSCYEFNALLKMNLMSGELSFINSFDGQEKFQKALYRDSIKVDNIIYFLPDTADSIVIFDVKSNQIENILLPIKDRICNGYNGILLDEKKILMVPLCFEEDFYFFDLDKKRFEVAEEINNNVRGMLDNLRDCLCLNIIQYNNIIVLPIVGTDIIIEITCQNGKLNLKKIRSKVIITSLIKCKNGYMVISNDGKSYVRYLNGFESEIKEVTGEANRYWAIKSDVEGNLICLDKANEKLLLYTDFFDDYICENECQMEWEYTANSCFFRETDYNDAELLYSINMNGIIVSKKHCNVFVKMKISNLEELEQYLHKSMRTGKTVTESDSFEFNDFLKLI